MKRFPPVSAVAVLNMIWLKPSVSASPNRSCAASTICSWVEAAGDSMARTKGWVRAIGSAETADLRKFRRFNGLSCRSGPSFLWQVYPGSGSGVAQFSRKLQEDECGGGVAAGVGLGEIAGE